MTIDEMSDYFDVVLQAHVTQLDNNQIDPLVFDEYEKSVFLTVAQEEFVRALYNKTGNFDVTEEDKRLLDNLVKSYSPEEIPQEDQFRFHIKSGSQFYQLPDDLMFIVYEQCMMDSKDACIASRVFDVYPCSHDEFNRTQRNPFRGSNEHRVLRIDAEDNVVELVSDYKIKIYKIRYIKQPLPIILINLPDGLTINGSDSKSESCELDEQLHKRVVEYAVQKALKSKSINFNTK